MNVRYRVELSQSERAELTALVSGGKHAARKLKRAQILLAADAGASDEEIARSIGVGGSTVHRTKRRFLVGNLEAALSEARRRRFCFGNSESRGTEILNYSGILTATELRNPQLGQLPDPPLNTPAWGIP
jgi:hypothetical protein